MTEPTRGEREEWRAAVYAALLDAELPTEAEAFFSCAGDKAVFWTQGLRTIPNSAEAKAMMCCEEHPEHPRKILHATCDLRICPDCARRQSNRLMARYVPVIQEALEHRRYGYRLRKITLTTPISLTSPDCRQRMVKAWKDVLTLFDDVLSPGWRQRQGLLISAEFGPNGQRLHFHILHYGEYIDNRKCKGYPFSAAWQRATSGESEVVYLQEVKGSEVKKAVRESVKYATKLWKRDPKTGHVVYFAPDLMPILHKVLRGTRRVKSYGIFYSVGEPEALIERCEMCGSQLTKYTVSQWNFFVETGYRKEEQNAAWQSFSTDLANKSPTFPVAHSGKDPPAMVESADALPKQRQLPYLPAMRPESVYS